MANESVASWTEVGFWARVLRDYKPKSKQTQKIIQYRPIKILRVLCQKPMFTGSGVTLVKLIEKSKEEGLEQFVIFGKAATESNPLEGIIDRRHTLAINFQEEASEDPAEISFPVAGMSDEMPYKSTKFSIFDVGMLEVYLSVFAKKIRRVIAEFKPDIIHAHHLWLVTALCRVLSPVTPVIGHCHNTALRQARLAPHLVQFVKGPISDLDAIILLREDQRQLIKETFKLPNTFQYDHRMHVIGTGIDTNIFHPPTKDDQMELEKQRDTRRIIYVGKLSNAKGVPQLIAAFESLNKEYNGKLNLIIVGSGSGSEKEGILEQCKNSIGKIEYLGQVSQEMLADYFRESELFVLPSFYEGVPLVVLEALASGCLAVVTDLPGLQVCLEENCKNLEGIEYVQLPRMKSVDQPIETDLPEFIKNLKQAIHRQLTKDGSPDFKERTFQKIKDNFSWNSNFKQFLKLYESLVTIK